MKKMTLKSIVWKEGKHFVAQCLNFDVSSFGNTKISALNNLKEAVSLYLDGSPQSRRKTNSPQVVETIFRYS